VVAFVVISLVDVETFATWAITLVVKAVAIVRATKEAVVTCGHEVPHGTGICNTLNLGYKISLLISTNSGVIPLISSHLLQSLVFPFFYRRRVDIFKCRCKYNLIG
jgi:hypothetical protein